MLQSIIASKKKSVPSNKYKEKIDEDDNIGNSSVDSSDKEEFVHSTTSNKNDVVDKETIITPTLPPHPIGKQLLPVSPPGATLVIPPSTTATGGSQSRIYLPVVRKVVPKNETYEPQQGFSQKSVLLCPEYIYIITTLLRKKIKPSVMLLVHSL